MIKRIKRLWIPKGICFYSVCFILLIKFSSASIYHPNSSDDENMVNADGMWQKNTQTLKPATKISQGASRFDVGGILTAFGMKQGASIFALVLFPIVFPLMILLGIAMFVISLFGTSGLAVAGRRSGSVISNSAGGVSGFTPGYKVDHDGFPISLTNRDGFASDVWDDDACVERFACEMLLHGGVSIIGKKATLQLLRGLNVEPIILPNLSPGRKSKKVWKCSSLKCNWKNRSPWTENMAIYSGS